MKRCRGVVLGILLALALAGCAGGARAPRAGTVLERIYVPAQSGSGVGVGTCVGPGGAVSTCTGTVFLSTSERFVLLMRWEDTGAVESVQVTPGAYADARVGERLVLQ